MRIIGCRNFQKLLLAGMLFVSVAAVAPGAAQDNCNVEVTDATQLTTAINSANDESACAGRNTITVTSSLTIDTAVSDDPNGQNATGYPAYGQGANAFPIITSDIVIKSSTADGARAVIRHEGTTQLRFFTVDATVGGRLTLQDLEFSGANAQGRAGGVVYVRGSTTALAEGDTVLTISNSRFDGNNADFGGVLALDTLEGRFIRASISNSALENNTAVDGAAIVNEARNGGQITLLLENTRIANNSARRAGGAIYNNPVGRNGSISITTNNTDFLLNTQGGAAAGQRGGVLGAEVQCFDNGAVTYQSTSSRTTDASCIAATASTPITAEEAQAILQAPVLRTGEVQVKLSWDNQVDMDLEITEPNGNTVNYRNLLSTTGGYLDVDSNADCPTGATSGVENIVWASDAPAGTYSIIVNEYDLCGAPSPANWTLTVTVMGQVVVNESGSGDMETPFTFSIN